MPVDSTSKRRRQRTVTMRLDAERACTGNLPQTSGVECGPALYDRRHPFHSICCRNGYIFVPTNRSVPSTATSTRSYMHIGSLSSKRSTALCMRGAKVSLRRALDVLPDDRATTSAARQLLAFMESHSGESVSPERLMRATGLRARGRRLDAHLRGRLRGRLRGF